MTDDQKRALAIGGIGLAGFVVWRRMHSGTSAAPSGPSLTSAGGASGSIAPYTPQAPLVLSPGESVYDPNSEGLLNTPTAPLQSMGGKTFAPTGEQAFSQTHSPGKPNYVVNVNYPKRHSRKKHRSKPAKRKVTAK